MGDGVHQGAVAEVDANVALIHAVDAARDQGDDKGQDQDNAAQDGPDLSCRVDGCMTEAATIGNL